MTTQINILVYGVLQDFKVSKDNIWERILLELQNTKMDELIKKCATSHCALETHISHWIIKRVISIPFDKKKSSVAYIYNKDQITYPQTSDI